VLHLTLEGQDSHRNGSHPPPLPWKHSSDGQIRSGDRSQPHRPVSAETEVEMRISEHLCVPEALESQQRAR